MEGMICVSVGVDVLGRVSVITTSTIGDRVAASVAGVLLGEGGLTGRFPAQPPASIADSNKNRMGFLSIVSLLDEVARPVLKHVKNGYVACKSEG